MFRCIPLFRGCNRQVECIDKRHCSLANVPDDVLRYPRTLEELFLDSNHIRDLPKGLFRLIKLRRLTLSDNEIGHLPSDIASLVNLVDLDISKNDISDIPENIKFLKCLQNADVSANPLTKLPAGFVQLKNLTILGLNDIQLSRLPNDFGNLINLLSLELRENSIRTLPPSFSNLSKLERLDLGSNEISELPALIGQLTSLQELWLDCNDLYTLPPEIQSLKKLTCLDVSENRLEYLPEEIGGLENLTDLHLSQNCLESLPEGIGKLYKLTIFKVDQNRLLSLTGEIGNCECLQELILTENLISELPSSIGRLVSLTNLNLDRNRLSQVPSQIGNLSRLGVLSLRENQLNFLPEETGLLKELHVLDVSGNRLQYLPITITALNLKALWLAENQSQPMLKFQTDVNERNGAKVLTCFLLPQQEYHPDSMENLLRDSGEQDSRLSWDQNQKSDRASFVKFIEDDKDVEDDDRETQFVRHDTPHPRELKARHNKLLISKSKSADSSVSVNDEKSEDVADNFRPQRSSITSGTSSSSETSANQFKDAVQSLADIPDSDVEQREALPEDGTTEETDARRPLYRAQTREDLLDEDSAAESSEEEEKHVGFDSDVDEHSDKPNKLHRRDTPHHLKNKRINLVDSQKDHEKVLAILAQTDRKPLGDDTCSSASSPLPPDSETEKEPCNINGFGSRPFSGPEMEIVIRKTTAGLGLSIAGGIGSTPYVGDDKGIFVSKVISGGPAEAAGLRIGDKILSVNETLLENVSHFDAVDALKSAGNTLVMRVKRDPNLQIDTENATFPTESIAVQNGSAVSPMTPSPITVSPVISPSVISIASPKPEIAVKPYSTFVKELPATPNLIEGHDSMNTEKVVNDIQTLKPTSDGISQQKPLSDSISQQKPLSDVLHQNISLQKPPTETPSKNKRNLVIDIPKEDEPPKIGDSASPSFRKQASEEFDIKFEILHTTLIREQNGLGLSLSDEPPDGRHSTEGGIFISQIASVGAAAKDGKLKVGDRVLTLNGVDMDGARQDQAVALLSGLDRFVRLVVQRTKLVPRDPNTPHLPEMSGINSSSLLGQKSPKLVGVPRPYTPRVYSAGSYMANRPSYMGSYRRPTATTEAKPGATTFSLYTKLPGLRNDPLDIGSAVQSPVVEAKDGRCANHVDAAPLTEVVSLVKAGGPLGLSIIGGVDHSCHPFGLDEPGIFISKIVPEGAAAKTGKLKVGDRLLKVNGAEVQKASHKDAVLALLAPTYEMTLTVRHDPLPFGWQEIIITKHSSEKLGMGIKGGVGGQSGNPDNTEDEGIFISWVNTDGAAGSDGRLQAGMRIVEVNQVTLLGATYQEAITALRTACDSVRLVVCDGYNRTTTSERIEPFLNMKTSLSSSSIDREDEMMTVIRQEQEVIKETAEWEREDLEKIEQLREKCGDELQSHTADSNANYRENAIQHSYTNPEENMNQVMFSTPVKHIVSNNSQDNEMPSPILVNSENSNLSESTDESMVDPIRRSRLPGAKPVFPKMSKNLVPDIEDPEQLTFSEKKRRFELVTNPSANEGTDEAKEFSYVSAAELERMKEDEERKMATMSEEELKDYRSMEVEEIDDILHNNNLISNLSLEDAADHISNAESTNRQPMMTAKAERRKRDQSRPNTLDDENLSISQQRSLQAAKKAAWRQARMKSLEDDALQAEFVISATSSLEELEVETDDDDEEVEDEVNHCTKVTQQDVCLS